MKYRIPFCRVDVYLKWPTLQHRRESARVILLYKIINHVIQIPPNYFPTPSPVITNRSSIMT